MWRRPAALCAALLGLGFPAAARAHPLHTTITELTEDKPRGTVRAMIRVFADDLGKAISRAGGNRPIAPSAWESAAMTYVNSAFSIADRSGRKLALRSCGIRTAADLDWVCVEADAREGLSGARVRSAILTDLYDDQINIVQATVTGARKSLLFTRGDREKAL